MHRLCRDGKVASFFFQRSESEFARFTAQEAFFEAERPSHAVPGWSFYRAVPLKRPKKITKRPPRPRAGPRRL